MADFDFSKDTDDERLLLIAFNNERPMSAARVATVLRALDSDYRAITGRELVLGRMELGSTWIWLTDAAIYVSAGLIGTAAALKAIEDIAAFAKKLKDGFKEKKLPGEGWLPSAPSVDRSIVAMAKASEETNSTIIMRQTRETAGVRDTLEVEISPAEAKKAKERVKNKPKKGQAIGAPPKLVSKDMDIRHITDAMRELPPATGDIEAVIRALVQAHIMHGSTYVLEQVAITLEHEGRSDISTIIRQLLGKGRGLVHVEV